MVVKFSSRGAQQLRHSVGVGSSISVNTGSPIHKKLQSTSSSHSFSIRDQFLKMLSTSTTILSPKFEQRNKITRVPITTKVESNNNLIMPLEINNNFHRSFNTLQINPLQQLQEVQAQAEVVPEPDEPQMPRTDNHNYGEKLYLTPYIENGFIEEGQKLARVENLTDQVESYSGYLTVNSEIGSNLFFWFFPAAVSYHNFYKCYCALMSKVNFKFCNFI